MWRVIIDPRVGDGIRDTSSYVRCGQRLKLIPNQRGNQYLIAEYIRSILLLQYNSQHVQIVCAYICTQGAMFS